MSWEEHQRKPVWTLWLLMKASNCCLCSLRPWTHSRQVRNELLGNTGPQSWPKGERSPSHSPTSHIPPASLRNNHTPRPEETQSTDSGFLDTPEASKNSQAMTKQIGIWTANNSSTSLLGRLEPPWWSAASSSLPSFWNQTLLRNPGRGWRGSCGLVSVPRVSQTWVLKWLQPFLLPSLSHPACPPPCNIQKLTVQPSLATSNYPAAVSHITKQPVPFFMTGAGLPCHTGSSLD